MLREDQGFVTQGSVMYKNTQKSTRKGKNFMVNGRTQRTLKDELFVLKNFSLTTQ